jgi:hypothetical protein
MTTPVNFLNTQMGRLLRFVLAGLALLFGLTAVIQHQFIQYQLRIARESEAGKWAREISGELAYTTKWNLEGFRRAAWAAPNDFVLTKEGLLIDVEGFVPGLIPQVTLPDGLDYGHPKSLISEIGEPWRLLAKKVQGGTVVLGFAYPANVNNADTMLVEDADLFGSSMESAKNVLPRKVHIEIDYCVVDEGGNVQYAIGGIPLKLRKTVQLQPQSTLTNYAMGERSYLVFTTPILDSSNTRVGSVSIPMDSTLERQTLKSADRFNIIFDVLLWSIVAGIFIATFINDPTKRGRSDLSLEEALKLPESETLEFKSSVRYDYDPHFQGADLKKPTKVNPKLECEIVEAVAAFLNTSGGMLVIGVKDDRTVLGLQPDYETLTKKKDLDGLRTHLQQIISKEIREDRFTSNVSVTFDKKDGKDVCILRIKASPKAVFIGGRMPKLIVRRDSSTVPLDVQEAITFAQEHFKE